MKKIGSLLGIFLMLCMMFGCKKEMGDEMELLPVVAEFFCYEVSESVDAIAVDENGILYTTTYIETEEIIRDEVTGEWTEEIQRICVYDLDGTCLETVDVVMGNGTMQAMLIENDKLYAILHRTSEGVTLYEVDITTWAVTKLANLEEYSMVERLVPIGDYFYFLGNSELVNDKEYTLHPDVYSYTYSGEVIGRMDRTEENLMIEFLNVDFPIDIFKTKEDTLMIYQYTQEQGFGFLEFYPQELILQEAGWKKDAMALNNFSMCEDGYLCINEGNLYYGTVDGKEAQLSTRGALLRNPVIYVKGFAFYLNLKERSVERITVTDILKDNREIHFLTHETNVDMPFGCGYQMKQESMNMEAFALKLLAQDSDFDMYLFSSRDSNSYNMKENGVFYPLNEVKWVEQYLNACFPYIKEIATNEEGDIWMLPVKLMIPGLLYDKIYSKKQEIDFSTMNFSEFLLLTGQMKEKESEKVNNSIYLMVEAFFQQYIKQYESFDTELFRIYAEEIHTLYEKQGEWNNSQIIPIRNNGILQGTIPEFLYQYTLYTKDWIRYVGVVEELQEFDRIGIVPLPSISEETKNIGTLTFLAVNPQSENLKATLEYISTFARYMMQQENTLLLADETMYTDNAFMKACYELYANGEVYFAMDSEIYWNDFWKYLEDDMELEDLVKEIERKRKMYVEE